MFGKPSYGKRFSEKRIITANANAKADKQGAVSPKVGSFKNYSATAL